jgi:hypothetical protein
MKSGVDELNGYEKQMQSLNLLQNMLRTRSVRSKGNEAIHFFEAITRAECHSICSKSGTGLNFILDDRKYQQDASVFSSPQVSRPTSPVRVVPKIIWQTISQQDLVVDNNVELKSLRVESNMNLSVNMKQKCFKKRNRKSTRNDGIHLTLFSPIPTFNFDKSDDKNKIKSFTRSFQSVFEVQEVSDDNNSSSVVVEKDKKMSTKKYKDWNWIYCAINGARKNSL